MVPVVAAGFFGMVISSLFIDGCWTYLKSRAALSLGPLPAEQTAILQRAPTCCGPYIGSPAEIPKYG
jgi:hypothetical protein